MVIDNIGPKVHKVMDHTGSAYSINRYTNWAQVAEVLLIDGWSVEQTIAIMNSKITRWAADSYEPEYGRCDPQAVVAYLTNSMKSRVDWVKEIDSWI